ncbi:MAG: GNAT family N-acetyltransferase [Firmicutes bacterium]|nr:GNAT family N-acetyltransferase [Bacillota bacterium]
MNTAIDISKTVLYTERLILRPWKGSDLEDFFEYASVDGVGQMAGWNPHKDIDVSRAILSRFIECRRTFALEYQGKVIGSLGIEEYDEDKFPEFSDKQVREIGYVLSKEFWGQGLMPEAVIEVIRYLFEEQDLDLILCAHFLSNARSARVQEKCGFRHYSYGTYETKFGTVEDDETNILTREEWLLRNGISGDDTSVDH